MPIKIKKLQVEDLIVYGIIIIAASFAYIGSSYIVNRIQTSESEKPPTLIEKPSVYPDYDAIKGEAPDEKIKLIRFTDGCEENGCVSDFPATKFFNGIKKNYLIKGKISRGYLYIEAAVDYKRPLTNYDDFYFTLNYTGGHLYSDENLLPTPPIDISRYLYDLRSITYSYQQGVYKNVNFLSLLQRSRTFNIHTAVSSDRPGRVLKEVSIYYQCAEGYDCSIEEKK
ncbi:MAG: hypothetical protein A3J48_04130 [Candidatus Doudnabacteria bacterium RIFCSPHIGHO2_02_FULL_46_11]|uniref:Uncharacterized protein n=2 Tax=Bacteria candidate phyla TaxID=1783234 RepID=A0A1F5P8M5_9BACT|nr:MAG: hypothetical protein A3I57_02155 [Candidatus Beckwithbacteria bacterium RIFCSPLOWO2_02_FULL_47_23]OGE86301.1 MAG: hypothetical protein A3J48_04130 [Candidatus Doudnabacteria bacterium RIFCSPHIGHO2_02_FULL_46_11]